MRSALNRFIGPRRRFHAYGVGMLKSGTTSLAAMLSGTYHARHEPDKLPLLRAIVAHQNGTLSNRKMASFIRRRDRALHLEMEASAFLGFVAGLLVREYPEARFILTIRDCYSWLDSSFNHLLSRYVSPEQMEFLHWWLKPERYASGSHDRALEQLGLFPLECYLQTWADHNRLIMEKVPRDRLLVVRTDEISRSIPRIADFLGIPAQSIVTDRSHQYRAQEKFDVLAKMDQGYLSEAIEQICSEVWAVALHQAGDAGIP
ncbi:MAG: sulfotransferase [Pseudomonadota bacterium]